ncbi:MAG: sulfurtransferase complex subunit TusC [Alteromonadaceae bacterium]|nr:sulfurtransferase complex subunit TusC [Alteromonadaceae bacterium]
MSEHTKSIAVLNSHSSFDQNHGKEALDIALIFGSYEQQVALFFQGDGVRQLIAQQKAEVLKTKDYLATFSALAFYDVETIYVCGTSLAQRGLIEDFHIDNAQVLKQTEFSATLRQYQTIIRF